VAACDSKKLVQAQHTMQTVVTTTQQHGGPEIYRAQVQTVWEDKTTLRTSSNQQSLLNECRHAASR
jgi:hypothetical protein